MNFLPFIFKKDLIRLRLLFLVWLLLIIAQAALGIGGINIAAELLEFQMFLPLLTKLISFLQGLMVIVMVPLIIQEDSLVGTTAFWFTRPISRKGLLITKFCFVSLFLIAVPFITEIFVLAANKITVHHIILAIPEILIEKLAFVIPFFILAILTPKFSRYALVGISVFAVFAVIGIISSVVMIFLPILTKFLYNFDLYKNPSLEFSVKVAKDIFVIVVGSLLIGHQFLTRYTARTVRWFVVAYFVMMCFSRVWSWDFLKEVVSTKAALTSTSLLKVDFDTHYVTISDEFRYRKKDARGKSIDVKEITTGLPEGQFAILRGLTDVYMKYPDGSILKAGYVSTKKKETFTNEKFMAPLQAVLKNVKLLNPFQGKFSYTEIFSLEDIDLNRYKDKAGTYSANASLDVYKYNTVAEVPLKQGAKDSFGSEQIVIYDILERPNGISVIVGEKKTNLLFDRAIEKKSRYDFAQDIYSDFNNVYLIVNQKRNEAFLAESGGNLYADMMAAYGPTRLETKAKQFDFTYINDRSGALPQIDKNWLADAKLVRIDAEKIGKYPMNLQIANFTLPSQSTEQNPKIDEVDRQLRQSDKQYEQQKEKWGMK